MKADLLDAIYLCQERQGWYQDYLRAMGAEPVDFVGRFDQSVSPQHVAGAMRDRLSTAMDARLKHSTYQAALSALIASVEEAGVLVMVSGVVGSNNRRRLDPRGFCGFTLADSLAPLIFVNGADAKSAQMFTVAHELAHMTLDRMAADLGVTPRRECPN